MACDIVTGVADVLGPEAMTEVVTGLLSGSRPAAWQDWLGQVEPRLEEIGEVEPQLARDLPVGAGLVTTAELTAYDS